MKIACRYCGSYIDTSNPNCPNCGAPNQDFVRMSDEQPKTIEEMKQWYVDHNLPPYETTRFFIGEDRVEPRCFGIYKKPDGNIVVYKNKSDGNRAIRYEGPDEAYAVNEIYQKLKSEILNQKAANHSATQKEVMIDTGRRKKSPKLTLIKILFGYLVISFGLQLVLIPGILIATLIFPKFTKPSNNTYVRPHYNCDNDYYYYNDDYYYYSTFMETWYGYEEQNGNWKKLTDVDEKLYKNWEDYKSSEEKFKEQNEKAETYAQWSVRQGSSYSDNDSYDNGWDNDSYWDSDDSWDSGYTDWDSDW